ncbi:MAG: pyridoxal phosphate-dependent aminotransferase [Spirochaetales bacterium]|nr:pyridoxal phosphate-dependent aminotransferase [Spirochaetales bacterium]
MTYELDEIIDRKGTNSMKWEFMHNLSPKAKETTLPSWVADMDFACPPPVVEALHKRVDRRIFGYSSHETERYWQAVTGWFSRRFHWQVDRKDIFIAPGVVPAIATLVNQLTREGEGVIIQSPVYYPFGQVIAGAGRTVVNNPLIETDGYYTMDFDHLEKLAREKNNAMMVLCSPHNPVGRVWTKEELTRVGKSCLENGVILVSDEIHFDLIRGDRKHQVLADLFPGEDGIITCTAPSKTFNMAGMQCSHIVIPREEYQKAWKKERGHALLNPLSIAAVEAAYTECDDWLDQLNAYLDGNMAYIDRFVKDRLPKARHRISEGTYLAWLDLRGYEFTPRELEDRMIEKGDVLFDMGAMFGKEGEGFLRINAACPRPLLEECMNRVEKALL